MKNQNVWLPTKFVKNRRGKFEGTYMHQILGPLYEAGISKYCRGNLLDLGAGAAPLYYFYKDFASEITCVDWGNTAHGTSFLDYEFDLNEKLPLSSSNFDTIVCTDVLEHIAEPSQLFSEISRVLKTEGRLLLGVPFYYWLHETPHDYFRYTRYALEKFCKENSLEVLELTAYGGIPEIFLDLSYKGYSYLNFPAKTTMLKMINRIGKFMISRKYVRKVSRITSVNFPLGYFLVAEKKG